jgi:hypothetical protein
MTMHLAHPALTTLGKRKGKQKWASSEQKKKAEQLDNEWKELQKKWQIDADDRSKKRALKAKPYVASVNPRISEIRKIASVDSGHTGAVTIKQTPQYTGDKLLGITIVHKSCLQPVFTQQEAIDAANMRR